MLPRLLESCAEIWIRCGKFSRLSTECRYVRATWRHVAALQRDVDPKSPDYAATQRDLARNGPATGSRFGKPGGRKGRCGNVSIGRANLSIGCGNVWIFLADASLCRVAWVSLAAPRARVGRDDRGSGRSESPGRKTRAPWKDFTGLRRRRPGPCGREPARYGRHG